MRACVRACVLLTQCLFIVVLCFSVFFVSVLFSFVCLFVSRIERVVNMFLIAC